MFLQASVCPWGKGVSASVHGGIPHPPPRADTPQADTPREQTPPRADTPPKQTPPTREQIPPRETPTAADGTHPTGMHSSLSVSVSVSVSGQCEHIIRVRLH